MSVGDDIRAMRWAFGGFVVELAERVEAAIASAREEGHREERADVLAWLRKWASDLASDIGGSQRMLSEASAVEDAAGEIERGEHVGAAKKVKP